MLVFDLRIYIVFDNVYSVPGLFYTFADVNVF